MGHPQDAFTGTRMGPSRKDVMPEQKILKKSLREQSEDFLVDLFGPDVPPPPELPEKLKAKYPPPPENRTAKDNGISQRVESPMRDKKPKHASWNFSREEAVRAKVLEERMQQLREMGNNLQDKRLRSVMENEARAFVKGRFPDATTDQVDRQTNWLLESIQQNPDATVRGAQMIADRKKEEWKHDPKRQSALGSGIPHGETGRFRGIRITNTENASEEAIDAVKKHEDVHMDQIKRWDDVNPFVSGGEMDRESYMSELPILEPKIRQLELKQKKQKLTPQEENALIALRDMRKGALKNSDLKEAQKTYDEGNPTSAFLRKFMLNMGKRELHGR